MAILWPLATMLLLTAVAEGRQMDERLQSPANLTEEDSALVKRLADENWIVVQRRIVDQTTAFKHSNWNQYVNPFGKNTGWTSPVYWYGLENLHQKTKTGRWKVMLRYKYENGFRQLVYNDFKVDSRNRNYRVHVGYWAERLNVPYIKGSSYFLYNNNARFSTWDNDNDDNSGECARKKGYGGGWWFNSCTNICLNCDQGFIDLHNNPKKVSKTSMFIAPMA